MPSHYKWDADKINVMLTQLVLCYHTTSVTLTQVWHWHKCDTDTSVMLTQVWHWHKCDTDTSVTMTQVWHWQQCDADTSVLLTQVWCWHSWCDIDIKSVTTHHKFDYTPQAWHYTLSETLHIQCDVTHQVTLHIKCYTDIASVTLHIKCDTDITSVTQHIKCEATHQVWCYTTSVMLT
jgi:hypothetical protein